MKVCLKCQQLIFPVNIIWLVDHITVHIYQIFVVILARFTLYARDEFSENTPSHFSSLLMRGAFCIF